MVHWADHLLEAAKLNGSADLRTMQAVIESFLHNHCKSPPYKHMENFPKVIENSASDLRQTSLSQFITEIREDLDLSAVLQQVRSAVETMSASDQTRLELEKLYGPNLYKCTRIDCTQFFEGYTELHNRERHHRHHERKYFCTFEGCIAARTGSCFVNANQLTNHVTRFHDPFIVSARPLSKVVGDESPKRLQHRISVR